MCKFLKFLGFMWNPLSWVMEIAAIMAIALANGGGRTPDCQVGILVLLVINSTISFVEENNACNAAQALMAGLAPKTKVECSQMADMAEEIVKANGFSNVITVLKGKIEEIDLPVAQVDIIISEWMRYFLLYENMLNTVLYARDKWLVSNGLVLPDKASLYLTVIEDADYKDEKIEFWKNVNGFDMSCIGKQSMMEPLVDTVDQNQIITNCHLLKTLSLECINHGMILTQLTETVN